MKLSNPAPGRPITSPYGPRRHPITGELGRLHRGIDYGGRFRVLAAGPGVVSKISYNGNKTSGGGHVVIIDHGEIHTVYYHGATRTALKVGDRVNTGDFIYLSGSTGASTGDHLHFEVRRGPRGLWGTDVDPTPYLNGNAAVIKLPVNGRGDRRTWNAWQTDLQAKGLYLGRIDGIQGPITNRAIQAWSGMPQTGVMDRHSRRAVQMKIGVKVDGVWGRETWSTIQRKLNEGSM
jgi:murein DD-endopeptidase MepM/ murein hydrolase activator NlpD